MNNIRLIPIVGMAALALLVLKGIGILTGGGYVLTGLETASAQSQEAQPAIGQGEDLFSESEVQAANRASETLFARAQPTPTATGQIDAVPYAESKAGEKIPLGSTDGVALTERAVLERLGERRTELDLLARELDDRMALVEAAEKRLSERATALEALEARINTLVEERKALDDEQFNAVVSMYETMKPKDAAAIFNQLEMSVLQRVARHMSPRKLAPVLAAMSTNRAQELTLRLAEAQPEPTIDQPIENLTDLPQIVGQ